MERLRLILYLTVFTNLNLYSQAISIYGSVSDENNEPLIGATIQISKNTGTTTNEKGIFALTYFNEDDKQLNISIRYIGYLEMDTVILDVSRDVHLEIKLISKSHVLPDLIIEGKRDKNIIDEEKTVLDFCILDKNLITLTHDNNKRTVSIYSITGDLKTKKIIRKEYYKLHNSGNQNVHLVGKENCLEIDFQTENIGTKEYDRNKFHQLIEKYILFFGNKYVFKEYSNHNKKATYFIYPEPSKPAVIAEVFDLKAAKVSNSYYREIIRTYHRSVSNPKENNISYGINQNNIIEDGSWDGDLIKLVNSNKLHALVSYYLGVENRKVKVFEFEKDSNLLIFDLGNYKLKIYDETFKQIKVIDLENDKSWNNCQLLQDDINSNIYMVNEKNEVFLIEFETDSVSLYKKSKLKSNSGIISKILISSNTIFYLNRNAHNSLSKILTFELD